MFNFGGALYHGPHALKVAQVQLTNAMGRKFMEEVVNTPLWGKGNLWRRALLIQKYLDGVRAEWDLGRMDVFRERAGLSGHESRYQTALRNVGIHRPAKKLAAMPPLKKKVAPAPFRAGYRFVNGRFVPDVHPAQAGVVRRAARQIADGEIAAVPDAPGRHQPQEAPQVRIGIFR